jgi:hypothetical protein
MEYTNKKHVTKTQEKKKIASVKKSSDTAFIEQT